MHARLPDTIENGTLTSDAHPARFEVAERRTAGQHGELDPRQPPRISLVTTV